MNKKIDSRIPKEIESVFPPVKSPWEKIVSFRDAVHYCQRYNAAIGSATMQALRILVPDYAERATVICNNAYNRLAFLHQLPGVPEASSDNLNMHPFMRGNFIGGLQGDAGDEQLLMCGRVNDFGSYRAEKELDNCYWDIVGSELCRSTDMSLQACGDYTAKLRPEGPQLEYHMVEAKGCGDRHCRIVAECRKKYPMPDHEIWECMGPVATADQIKYTKEEDCVPESMMLREECDFLFSNGTNTEGGWETIYPMVTMSHSFMYTLPAFDDLIREGRATAEQVDHVLHCVCEAAGKATFTDGFSKEGLRQWMGVPHSISEDDGRLMGGYLEMFLQCMRCGYEIEAFNKDEAIYIVDRAQLESYTPRLIHCYLWYWYGTVKSMVNAQWSLWEEDSPEGKVRIKIAKKIDKFC